VAADESPYFFSPAVFTAAADAALDRDDDTPSDSVAREALPAGGTVLDVGVGAGAASLRLPARHVIGVDSNVELLDAFVARAASRGVRSTAIHGSWPDVESQAPTADIAVCHHVVYNVGDLAGFAAALTSHAERRVVMELTAVHPMMWMAPYWLALHDIGQPDRPTVDDAVAVLTQLGLDVRDERWQRPVQMIGEDDADAIARIARRLCLTPDRHGELARLLARTPPPTTRAVVTLWWERS
jgi:cyclopropane fatty-acyl-phospholipid synthase-like methyltransferase